MECWCGRVDSNHHALASASPSSWCVCQFRHDRNDEAIEEIVTEAATSGEQTAAPVLAGSAPEQAPAEQEFESAAQ
jgi:hypothetical protein